MNQNMSKASIKYKNMKKIICTVLATQVLFLVSCGEKKNAETSSIETETSDGTITITKEQFNSNGMVLGSLEEKSFPVTIQTNGIIDVPPENRAVVSATMGGYIKRTPLIIGDAVKKGQRFTTAKKPYVKKTSVLKKVF